MTRTLDLSDAEYWTQPDKDCAEVSFDILKTEPLGFIWGLPAEVDLEERATIPVAGYFKCTIAVKKADRLKGGTTVVAVRQENNRVYAAPAFRDVAAPSGGKTPQGKAVDFFSFDLRERVRGLPWRDGTFAVHLLSFDVRSEARPTRLVTKASRDPAVAAFLESKRRPGYPRPVWPPRGEVPAEGERAYPHYRQDPGSPPLPAEEGIELQVPRVAVLEPGSPCLLQGSFRLPVLERERVKPAPEPAPGESAEDAIAASGWADVGDPDARAVLPITLVVLQEGEAVPRVCVLQVPVYGDDGSGHFNVDLLRLPGLNPQAKNYCLYLFCGPAAAGPFRFSFVTPDMLPPPGE